MAPLNQSSNRSFFTFVHKDAKFRIACKDRSLVTGEIVKQRRIVENYIASHPGFYESLVPLPADRNAPLSVQRMLEGSAKAGVGPMASVAGTMAQAACEAAVSRGIGEVIVENGGDIYLYSQKRVVIGLYAGASPVADQLAFVIEPSMFPLSICSSSSTMGHSLSFGKCDLATVVSKNAALADAAATRACNEVQSVEDLEKTANLIEEIEGIEGILLIKGDKVCISGTLPKIIKHTDDTINKKITIYDE